MILLMVLLFLAAFVLLMLFTPVILNIDSEKKDYSIKWGGIIIGSIIPAELDLLLRLRITFWKREWSLFELLATRRDQTPASSQGRTLQNKKSRTGFRHLNSRRMLRLMRTCRIERFALSLDTDDYAVNGMLYPVFYFLDGRAGNWQINFNNQFIIKLKVTNRPVRVLFAML